MSFLSSEFFFFFGIVLITAIFLNRRQLTVFLIFASFIFYSFGYPPYILLLIISTGFNFYAGKAIASTLTQNKKNIYLSFSLLVNLGLLAIFKYADFLVINLNYILSFLGMTYLFTEPHILLPIGISYYTFVSLGYLIDIHRGEYKPVVNLVDFSCFISFFPKLVAGPIVRAKEFFPQLKYFSPFNRLNIDSGFGLILLGFFKKAVIADNISTFVDRVYGNPSQFGSAACWLATVCFAIQLYCDFSGYIDIARGASRIIGFELPQNFRWPYLSESVRDFWRRWHMTLSFWIRDYLYIPLGGSRCSRPRMLINLFITWFVMGLWHGAAWTFIAWGLFHGLMVTLEHIISKSKIGVLFSSIPSLLKIFFTFSLVTVGWVFFRASDLASAVLILQKMFSYSSGSWLQGIAELPKLHLAILLGSTAIHCMTYVLRDHDISTLLFVKSPWMIRMSSYVLMTASIIILSGKSTSFIYFKF